jgi:hypothetical protein
MCCHRLFVIESGIKNGVWLFFTLGFIAFCGIEGFGQDSEIFLEGDVSYTSSKNIYVKFNSTKHIRIGDTLYISPEGQRKVPGIIVKQLSSISCVGEPIGGVSLQVGVSVYARHISNNPDKDDSDPFAEAGPAPTVEEPDPAVMTDEIAGSSEVILPERQEAETRGRLSLSSYSNFSNTRANNTQRFRYRFSFNASNIGGSKFSTESYLSFSHRAREWDEVKENIYNALKIYSLAVNYMVDERTDIWFGRRINRNISNVGAIDGLQFERKLNNFTFGAIVGYRPDYQDYSLNPDLFQYGAYLGHQVTTEKGGNVQTSVAFFEQTNNFNIDRRFGYFQHSNTSFKNVYLFCSAELDLYEKVDNVAANALRLSSLFFSIRYKVRKNLSVSASYDTRKNVIYYETYKNFIDQLLEAETRQGFRFRINYRPIKFLSIGYSTGFRYQENNPIPSKNMHSYITYSRIPGIKASATLSINMLNTNYLNGKIVGLRMTRDLIPRKVYGSLNFRIVDYHFESSANTLSQKILGTSISWKISKQITLSMDYEGTFEKERNYNRIHTRIAQRF